MAKAFMSGVDALVLQEKTVNVTENGTVEVTPDEGKLLRKVTAKIDTPVHKAEQEKNLTVTKDGTYRVLPDEGKVLSAVNVEVDTPDKKEEQEKVVEINGNGTIDILPDTGKVLSRVTAVVNVEGGAPVPDVPDEPVVPEYSEGLLIKWYVYGDNHYCVNGRGSCTDSVVRIPEYYDDGVHGRDLVTRLGSVTEWNSETWMDETNYVFHNDELLEEIYLPSGISTLGFSDPLTNCPNLKKVYGVQNISSFELRNLPSLEYVEFTEKTLWMGGGICYGNKGGVVYDFLKCTAVPSFDSYGFGNEFGTDPVILVPAELYDEWKQTTNWVLYADYIVAKGQENAQEKTVEITENGSYEVTPDEGKLLRKVTANVAVEQRMKQWDVTVTTGLPSSGSMLTLVTDEWLKENRNNPTLCAMVLPKSPLIPDGTRMQGVWLNSNMSFLYTGGANYTSLSMYLTPTADIAARMRKNPLYSSGYDIGDLLINANGTLQVRAYGEYDVAVGDYAVIAFLV